MKSRFVLLTVMLANLSASANDISQATADVSPELFRGRALRKIPDLTWEPVPLSVEYFKINGRQEPLARFRGKVPSLSGSSLIYTIDGNLKTAKVADNGTVEIFIPLNRNQVTVRLRAIDENGKTYDDGIVISSSAGEKSSGKHVNFDIGMGVSLLNYLETYRLQRFEVSEVGLTIKSGANYQLSQKWELGGNGFITAIPISLSLTPAAIYPARWFGINGRLGYRFLQPNPRASYHILAGWYLWGMITTPAKTKELAYGVERLGGPQVFLTARYRLANRRMLNTYLKFATIQDATVFSTTNRELATGVAYQISPPKEGRRRYMLTLDVANAQFKRATQTFRLNSYSVGLSTNF